MKFLLFFITSIYSGIIFIFYKLNSGINVFSGEKIYNINFNSLTGNLFIDSILFLILAIFLFFYFSNLRFKKEEQKNNSPIIPFHKGDENNYIKEKNSIFIKNTIKSFFTNYIYYIGFILFYISIYLIFYSLGIKDFSYIILFLNLIIIISFFLSHKAKFFKDFIKINTILFSLYYIFNYLYYFIFGINNLYFIDLINTIFIFSFFVITFYIDLKRNKQNNLSGEKSILNTDNSLILYFFLYSFIVFSFYFKYIFYNYFNLININFSLIFIYISLFLNILTYFFLQRIVFFQNSKYVLRALSFLFGYISIIFSSIYLIKNINFPFVETFFYTLNNFIIISILIYLLFFNFKVHKKFQNYISLFFSIFSFVFLLNFILYKNIYLFGGDIANLGLILNLTISYFIVIFTYIYRQKYSFDYFFLHFCAYLVNILGITYYLFLGNFEILNLGIILLLDSILVFLSYFKIKKIGRGE